MNKKTGKIEQKNEKKTKEEPKKKQDKIDEEEISEKIEQAQKMSKETKASIYKTIFINILVAIAITLYFIFLTLGNKNIETKNYITDLKMFGIGTLAITIILFEYAYNKDNGKFALFGVETLVVAILTLIAMYVYILYKDKILIVTGTCTIVAIVYYIIKSVLIYIREKRNWKQGISDVKEIVS